MRGVAMGLLAVILAAALGGCGGRYAQGTDARQRLVDGLRATAAIVETAGEACPSPMPACTPVRIASGLAAPALLAVAASVEAGRDLEDVAVCAAPEVLDLVRAIELIPDVDLPPEAHIAIGLVDAYLPECVPALPEHAAGDGR